MATLDLDLPTALIGQLQRLTERPFGDTNDASLQRTVEAALEMRLLWLRLVAPAAEEVEEPIVDLEVGEPPGGESAETDLADWLFRRR